MSERAGSARGVDPRPVNHAGKAQDRDLEARPVMHCGSALQQRRYSSWELREASPLRESLNAEPYWDGQTSCPSRLPEGHVHHPRLADSHRMVYRQRASRYIGGIGPPDGERRPACSSTTSTFGQTARASVRSLPWSPFVCPRGPILTRIGPCDRGRKPPLTCGDVVEPPIGIEPMTYSLRGSYIHEKHSAGRHMPP